MLDVKAAEARGLLGWFILGSASFAWVTRAIYDLIIFFFSLIPNFSGPIIHLSNFLIVLTIFSLSLYHIHEKYKESNVSETAIASYNSAKKHKGVVFLLSVFQNFDNEEPYSVRQLEEDLRNNVNISKIRRRLFNTNWGPLIYEIDYHKEKLTYFWLACSIGDKGSSSYFGVAALLVNRIVPNCKVDMVPINEPNIISESDIAAIKNVYLSCSNYGLSRSDIVFNFTGGTAVMSGLMILATIDYDLSLEYLRRDNQLNSAIDTKGNYITELKDDYDYLIVNKQYLLSIETTRDIVKQKS